MKHVGVRLGVGVFCLAALTGCGGDAQTSSANGVAGAPGAQGVAGAAAIDTSGQPSELVMSCPAAAGTVALSLPCRVGRPLSGGSVGLGITECDLTDQADGQRLPPIALYIDLSALQLDVPQAVPMQNLPKDPYAGTGYASIAAYPGEHFSGSLTGTGTFSQVDATDRVFVGRLTDARVDWVGATHSFSCTVADSAFWAVAGDFL